MWILGRFPGDRVYAVGRTLMAAGFLLGCVAVGLAGGLFAHGA